MVTRSEDNSPQDLNDQGFLAILSWLLFNASKCGKKQTVRSKGSENITMRVFN